jgi:hypothetical protein
MPYPLALPTVQQKNQPIIFVNQLDQTLPSDVKRPLIVQVEHY